MKIIITEEQNEQLNRKIKLTVEKLGLTQARDTTFSKSMYQHTLLTSNCANSMKTLYVSEVAHAKSLLKYDEP